MRTPVQCIARTHPLPGGRRRVSFRRLLTVAALLLLLGCGELRREPACIDINTATASELERIRHIGPERARRIVALRAERPFETLDDLRRVEGVGPARVREIVEEGRACVAKPDSTATRADGRDPSVRPIA